MTVDTMLNDGMTRLRTGYSPSHRLTAAAKAGLQTQRVTAALKRCATQNLPAALIVAIALLLTMTAPAQTQNQSASQIREQLLQELNAGQLQDAVLLGQQAVSRWPRDAQFRHYLGVAYFKTGDARQAQDQLERARDLNPKDSATHFDLALVFLSQQDFTHAADELQAAVKLDSGNALAHVLLGRAYLNSNRSLQAIDEF